MVFSTVFCTFNIEFGQSLTCIFILIHIKKRLPAFQCRENVNIYNSVQEIVSHIYIQHHRLPKSLNSYEVLGQKMFSKLPLCLQDSAVSLDVFKFKLYKWLMLHNHNLFYDIREDKGEANRLLI